VLTGSKPDISNLRTWGQKVWVHDTKGTKLDGRAKEGYWVGIDEESRAHRIYWPGKRSVTVERSVRFIPEEVHVPLEGKDMEEFDELSEGDPVEEFVGQPEPDIDADKENKRSISPELVENPPNTNNRNLKLSITWSMKHQLQAITKPDEESAFERKPDTSDASETVKEVQLGWREVEHCQEDSNLLRK